MDIIDIQNKYDKIIAGGFIDLNFVVYALGYLLKLCIAQRKTIKELLDEKQLPRM